MASRSGCCLGNIVKLLILFALIGFGYLAVIAVFAPWAYYLGGHFHPIPYWSGVARVHTAKNGDYAVYIQLEPKGTGAHSNGNPYLSGWGYLCTPRGEKLRMGANAEMPKGIGHNPDGKNVTIGMYYWPALTGGFIADHSPSVGFKGQWQGETIALDDNKSFARAFFPDGTAYKRGDNSQPAANEDLHFTMYQGSTSDFDAVCAQITHK
jgi:hypothetical protein